MLFAFTEAISSIRDFMEARGSVLWLIAILVFFMWGMIFERIWYLSHAHQEYVANLSINGIQEMIKNHGMHFKSER